jgi:hypothetical protein
MQRKQLVPSTFAQSTNRSSGALPIRTIELDEIAPLGSNAFEESVRLACIHLFGCDSDLRKNRITTRTVSPRPLAGVQKTAA